MGDILDTIIVAGTFKRFVSAVQAAELVDTLRGGLFTVFAPEDEAFAKLPPWTVEGLLKDMPKLTAVLMYHIVAGKLTIDEISKMDAVKTIQGQEVKINAQKLHLHVNPKVNNRHWNRCRQRLDTRFRQGSYAKHGANLPSMRNGFHEHRSFEYPHQNGPYKRERARTNGTSRDHPCS